MFERFLDLANDGWDFLATWFVICLCGCLAVWSIVVMVVFSPILVVLVGIGWCREKYWERKADRTWINMEG